MLEKEHFVVVQQLSKQFLVRVTSVSKNGETFRGMIENGKDEGADIEAAAEDVKAYLGAHPDLGRVFSASTVRLVRVDDHPIFESLSWYWEVDDDVRKQILNDVKAGYKTLKEKGLDYLCEAFTVNFERVPKNLTAKTMVGLYRSRRNREDGMRPDELVLRWHPDMEAGALTGVFYHETGHGFWYHKMSEELQSKWLLAYLSCSELTHVFTEEDMLAACKRSWDDGLVATDERDEKAIGIMLWNLDFAYGLRWKDVQLLYRTKPGKLRNLLKSVARFGGFTSDRETHVSEYAGKSVEEYWCECWRVFLSGKALPESVSDLMDETFASLKGKRLNLVSTRMDDDDD